jgi:hypothetical protein
MEASQNSKYHANRVLINGTALGARLATMCRGLRPTRPHSYSLSGEPSAERYRASIKREAFGPAGANIDKKLQVGDVVDTSAARGNFTLRLHAAQPTREHARSAWRRGSGVGLSAQGFRGPISARPH